MRSSVAERRAWCAGIAAASAAILACSPEDVNLGDPMVPSAAASAQPGGGGGAGSAGTTATGGAGQAGKAGAAGASCPLPTPEEIIGYRTRPGGCTTPTLCPAASHWFEDDCGCGCVADACPKSQAGITQELPDLAACKAGKLPTCGPGTELFVGACGCGCRALGCPSTSMGGTEVFAKDPFCELPAGACSPGKQPYSSACGCGCLAEDCAAPGGVLYLEPPCEPCDAAGSGLKTSCGCLCKVP